MYYWPSFMIYDMLKQKNIEEFNKPIFKTNGSILIAQIIQEEFAK